VQRWESEGTVHAAHVTHNFPTTFLDYWAPNVVIATAGAFATIYLLVKRTRWRNAFVSYIGSQTLGIYVCHMLPLNWLMRIPEINQPIINAWIAYPFVVALALMSIVLVVAIQAVPVVKRICPR
jgi:surface polysaccharide O-acyltransferase-like enzyme